MRQPNELTFASFDGTPIFYRHWPARAEPRGAIVLFHRGHEHSGRLQHLVDELALDDYAMFAWDARGHGRNEGERGWSPGMGTSIKDVDSFARHICAEYGFRMEQLVLVAQSVGAVLAAAWVHDYAPPIRGMVLASPAFKVKLYVPFARPGLRLMHALRGKFFVNSYVKAKFLTHDPERIASYDADPLITRPIAVNILLGLYDTAERLIADAGAIRTPTQLLVSDSDWVVHHRPQHEFFARLGSVLKERHILPGFFHDTLGEKDRHIAIDKARAFIERLYAQAPAARTVAGDDHAHFSWREYHRLAAPLPPLSPRSLMFKTTRIAMATLGRLSAGVRLGLATGFDSGSTLDYVYRNDPAGITPIGQLFDRSYLNAIGWRGIRVRKENLELLLRAALERLWHDGIGARLLDIAAGHGRYVLDAVAPVRVGVESVLLRDYSALNVEAGTRLIAERGLAQVARFEQGDAFDEAALAAITPRVTLAAVSGLYELFPDNAPIRASLRGLAQAVEGGGYLIYTNQPWHPQVEFIARVLSSHRGGAPWVMRRRTQEEMDALVEEAGFEKLDQMADDWGIFTVSLARRRAESGVQG